MSVERYNARAAEFHWQTVWHAENAFAARDDDPRPGYVLNEPGSIAFGDVRGCVMADVLARYKRASGFTVLVPRDALDVRAINAAAATWTSDGLAATRARLKSMGLSLDWSRAPAACDPDHHQRERAAGPASVEADLDDVIETYG